MVLITTTQASSCTWLRSAVFNLTLHQYNNFEAGEGKSSLDTHFAHISHKIVRWVRVGNNLDSGQQLGELIGVCETYYFCFETVLLTFWNIYADTNYCMGCLTMTIHIHVNCMQTRSQICHEYKFSSIWANLIMLVLYFYVGYEICDLPEAADWQK